MSGYSGTLEITLFYLVIGAILSIPVVFVSLMLRARRRAERAAGASAPDEPPADRGAAPPGA